MDKLDELDTLFIQHASIFRARARAGKEGARAWVEKKSTLKACCTIGKKKLGGDLLSHTLVCSTIGDEGLDF